MPTREDGIPESSFEVGRKNLCDCNSLGGYMVSASFGGNGDIVLSYYPHYYRLRRGKKRHITLKFEESNKRGFVMLYTPLMIQVVYATVLLMHL